MDTSFFINNRKRLADNLKDQSLVVLFAGAAPQKTGDQEYQFTPNRNFYYLTGIDEPNIIFTLSKMNGNVEEKIYVEEPNPVMEKWIGKAMTKEEAKETSGIDSVVFIDSFKSSIQRMILSFPYEHLYLDLERQDWDAPDTPAMSFAKDVRDRFPHLQVQNVYHPICELRIYKTQEEIDQIKKAASITVEGIKELMRNTKPGMNEYESEAHFDFVLKKNGVKDHAFHTIVASGKNATVLHYEDNDQPIGDNEMVLLDLGAQWKYYSSDISHTFPANGRFTDRQKQIYSIVLKVLRDTNEMVKPGVKLGDLHDSAKNQLAKACLDIGLIEKEEDIQNYFFHGIGHYMGLDTHDVGTRRDRVLEPGMVLTIEPGLYIEEEGIGVRIEDDLLVTEDGYEMLNEGLPREPEEIEAFMAQKVKS